MTTEKLFALIGRQQVEIQVLREHLVALQARVAELTRPPADPPKGSAPAN